MAGSRSVASPTISFGLISIPVKVYLAAASESFSFNMITPDKNLVKQKLFDSITDKEVLRADCLRGYEYAKDQFITFTEEDIEALSGDKNNALELQEFVDDSLFNPIYVEKCYYLAPDRGAEKSFRLLASTMGKMGKMAVAKWYNRNKDNLVLIKLSNNNLIMFQMYYANEIRTFEYQFSDKTIPTDEELTLAKKLVNQLSSKQFDVKKYHDEFAERIRAAIETKLSGQEKFVSPVKQEKPNTLDLLALLQASLNEESEPHVVRLGDQPTTTRDDLGGHLPPTNRPGLKKTRPKKT